MFFYHHLPFLGATKLNSMRSISLPFDTVNHLSGAKIQTRDSWAITAKPTSALSNFLTWQQLYFKPSFQSLHISKQTPQVIFQARALYTSIHQNGLIVETQAFNFFSRISQKNVSEAKFSSQHIVDFSFFQIRFSLFYLFLFLLFLFLFLTEVGKRRPAKFWILLNRWKRRKVNEKRNCIFSKFLKIMASVIPIFSISILFLSSMFRYILLPLKLFTSGLKGSEYLYGGYWKYL